MISALSHKSSIIRLVLAGVIVLTLSISSIQVTLKSLKEEAVSTQKNIAYLYANTFEKNLSQLLMRMNDLKENTNLSINDELSRDKMQIFFKIQLNKSPYIRSISLADDKGNIIVSSNEKNIDIALDLNSFFPIPFGDMSILRMGTPWEGRDFFSAKITTIDHSIPKNGRYFLPIIEKISISDKKYYIVSTINPDYLANSYKQMLPLEKGTLEIYRVDGILLFTTKSNLQIGHSYFNLKDSDKIGKNLLEQLNNDSQELISAVYESRFFPFILKININEEQAIGYWDTERNKVLLTSALLIIFSGGLVFLLLIRYINESQRQRKQIEFEKKFRIGMEATHTGLWTWDYKTGEMTWDAQCYLILEYEHDSFQISPQKLKDLIHPENSEGIFEYIEGQLLKSKEFMLELRMKSAKDTWIWGQIKGTVIETDQLGAPLKLIGVFMNIDKQKKAESLHLSAVAFDTQDAVFISDLNEKIVKVNQAFSRITGYTEEEIIGKSPRLFQSGEHNVQFYNQMKKSLKEKDFWSGDVWNKTKNGTIYAAFLTISVIRDEHGILTHYLANFNDITNKKLKQKEIENLAYYDPLTNLKNRRVLDTSLNQLVNSGRAEDLFSAVIFIDLDKFKELNDINGHDVGDMVLVETAHRLVAVTRQNDVIARVGGDEFVIILRNIGHSEQSTDAIALTICKKILSKLNEPFSLPFGHYMLGVSIGYTTNCTNSTKDGKILLKEADKAMYISKNKGRNRISKYEI